MKEQGNNKKNVRKALSMLLVAIIFFNVQDVIVFANTISENEVMGNLEQSDNGDEDINSQPQEGLSVNNVSENDLRTGIGKPANPIHHCTKLDDGTDYTKFSYIYFGSYPQQEVTDSTMTARIDEAISTNGKPAENGIDVWIDGAKYRRISNEDVYNYAYFGDKPYRYFKWEKIRWKVLNNDGYQLLVVADKALDNQQYNNNHADVTWESSTIRSWLNGSFYDTAFSDNEKKAIVEKRIANEDNPRYETEGGYATYDKVYMLSLHEIVNDRYGFCSNFNTYSLSRIIKNTDYACARGARMGFDSNEMWWLRSSGAHSDYAAFVDKNGYVAYGGTFVEAGELGVCPVLNINQIYDSWSLAEDDTDKKEAARPEATIPSGSSVVKNTKLFLTCATSGANIYYTIDGTEPTTDSMVYAGAIILEHDVTIKAIAVCEGYKASGVAQFSYKIQENSKEEVKGVQGIEIHAPSKKLAAGKKVKLTLDVTPENASNKAVTWKTSNEKYATVDKNGKVTLKKAGAGKSVTITAEAKDGSGKKASIKIKIMKHAVKSIKLKASAKSLKAGKSMSIKATVKTTGKSVNKTLKWQSSNTKYATVNKKGKVTAKKAGKGKTVTITATSTDGSNKKAKVKIKIK